CSRFRLRTRSGSGFGVAAGRGHWGRVLFGCFLVFLATVVRDVKTAALENKSGARADHLFDFPFAPFLLSTKLLRTNRQRFGCNRLKFFKLMSAFFADVLIRWHIGSVIRRGESVER